MENKRRRREYFIRKNNRAVPDIIYLDTKYNNDRPPKGAPVSDEKSSVYYLLVHPTTESEGYYVHNNAYYDDGSPDSPSPDYNIPSSSQPSPPNTSQKGNLYQEVYQAEPKRRYQHKQWPKPVWKRGRTEKMKHVELNKLNRHICDLTFGPHTIPPMAQKCAKERMRLNYKQYKRSIFENSDMLLHIITVGE